QGGLLCGPVVGNILSESLRYLDVKPDYTVAENNVKENFVPDLKDKTIEEAKNILSQSGFNIGIQGNENAKIVDQIPKSGAKLIDGATVQVYTDESAAKQVVKVPDVRGKSMVETIKLMTAAGLNVKIVGTGTAIIQDPYPGVELDKGSIVTVKFTQGTEWE
ncbi:MAG: PASTA domain-containing protein, partial [Clostridia bacterium]